VKIGSIGYGIKSLSNRSSGYADINKKQTTFLSIFIGKSFSKFLSTKKSSNYAKLFYKCHHACMRSCKSDRINRFCRFYLSSGETVLKSGKCVPRTVHKSSEFNMSCVSRHREKAENKILKVFRRHQNPQSKNNNDHVQKKIKVQQNKRKTF
jgi:hypothetical protein